MTARFRIRTPRGQELSFASHEMFEEFIRAGDLSPDDLVYDGETGEWAPARTHPLVLEIEYAQEEQLEGASAPDAGPSDVAGSTTVADARLDSAETDAASEEDGAVDAAASKGGKGDPDGREAFGLELAPAVEGPTPEEEARAFVAKIESQRETEFDFGADTASAQGFKMDDSQVFAEMLEPEPVQPELVQPEPAQPEPVQPEPAQPEPAQRQPIQREPPRRRTERSAPSRARPKSTRASVEPPRRPEKKRGAGRKVAIAVVLAGVLGTGGYLGMGLLGEARADDTVEDAVDTVDAVPDDPPPPPPPEPVIATTEEAIRERAQERFLTSTQSLLRDLQPIPDVWLQGAYFALPSDYADIRDLWQSYLEVIRDVRLADHDRYQSAYELALDDAAIQGDARTARLEVALADFGADAEERNGHWDRVEALAVAAIQSHDALLGAEGLILHDAPGNSGRTAGIGAGTSGRDTDAQLLLDQVVDLMEGVLSAEGLGPQEGLNVRAWVWGGFLNVITN